MKTDKSLVLDLDETLVHSTEIESLDSLAGNHIERLYLTPGTDMIEMSYTVKLHKGYCWGIERPCVNEFLDFAEDYFQNIFVWSAGTKGYVEKICNHLFKNRKPPKIIWSRDRCEYVRKEEIYTKPLDTMCNYIQSTFGDPIDISKILFLDDREHTFRHNPGNGVVVPAWAPPAYEPYVLDRSDNALLQFKSWCLKPSVIHCTDVRSLDKTDIFIN